MSSSDLIGYRTRDAGLSNVDNCFNFYNLVNILFNTSLVRY